MAKTYSMPVYYGPCTFSGDTLTSFVPFTNMTETITVPNCTSGGYTGVVAVAHYPYNMLNDFDNTCYLQGAHVNGGDGSHPPAFYNILVKGTGKLRNTIFKAGNGVDYYGSMLIDGEIYDSRMINLGVTILDADSKMYNSSVVSELYPGGSRLEFVVYGSIIRNFEVYLKENSLYSLYFLAVRAQCSMILNVKARHLDATNSSLTDCQLGLNTLVIIERGQASNLSIQSGELLKVDHLKAFDTTIEYVESSDISGSLAISNSHLNRLKLTTVLQGGLHVIIRNSVILDFLDVHIRLSYNEIRGPIRYVGLNIINSHMKNFKVLGVPNGDEKYAIFVKDCDFSTTDIVTDEGCVSLTKCTTSSSSLSFNGHFVLYDMDITRETMEAKGYQVLGDDDALRIYSEDSYFGDFGDLDDLGIPTIGLAEYTPTMSGSPIDDKLEGDLLQYDRLFNKSYTGGQDVELIYEEEFYSGDGDVDQLPGNCHE